jgi:hypothetical protein
LGYGITGTFSFNLTNSGTNSSNAIVIPTPGLYMCSGSVFLSPYNPLTEVTGVFGYFSSTAGTNPGTSTFPYSLSLVSETAIGSTGNMILPSSLTKSISTSMLLTTTTSSQNIYLNVGATFSSGGATGGGMYNVTRIG